MAVSRASFLSGFKSYSDVVALDIEVGKICPVDHSRFKPDGISQKPGAEHLFCRAGFARRFQASIYEEKFIPSNLPMSRLPSRAIPVLRGVPLMFLRVWRELFSPDERSTALYEFMKLTFSSSIPSLRFWGNGVGIRNGSAVEKLLLGIIKGCVF